LNVKFLPKFILYLGLSLSIEFMFHHHLSAIRKWAKLCGGWGYWVPQFTRRIGWERMGGQGNKIEYHHFTTKILIEQN
jgi:hypothetical protein